MKLLKKLLLIALFIIAGGQELKAQIDTNFWFAAPWVTPDHWWRDPIAFEISTFGNPTTVRIQQPASSYDTIFTVPANSLFTKYVTHIMNSLESKPADALLNTGVHITSDYPITVVYDIITRSPQFYNPETYSLKGNNGLGYEFVAPFQTKWNNQTLGGDLNGDALVTQPRQQISIVASEDNTTIWITPKCAIVGHPAGVTFSVVLPVKGNVYTVQNMVGNTNVLGNNLAGTVIVSDKPVSVTVSDDSVNPSGGGGCYDLMGDQIVPTDVIGTDYIVNKGFLNGGSDESLYAMAVENFTTVTINDGVTSVTTILNQGDTYSFITDYQLTYVTADKPIYMLHMSGYGCELGEAILPPLNCAGSDQVSFARPNGQSFLLDILCPAGSEDDFTLNGSAALVPAGAFSPVPGTGGAWMGAQISYTTAQIPAGTANLITNSTDYFSLGIINGGATTGCLYHYMSSFIRRVYVDAGIDQTLCKGNTDINLTGSVSGGVTTGIWSVLDGTGTFANPTNLNGTYTPSPSDYTQGYLTFVLQSTGNCLPEFDTMKVTFIESPQVTAGADQYYCRNNIPDIPVNGTLQYAVGSLWSGGTGGAFDDPSDLNTFYVASPADVLEDSLLLIITSSGSFFSCPDDKDTVVIYFTEPPVVFAGPDIVTCASEPDVPVAGSVTGASSTGIWTTSGSGSFSPSETDLSSTYTMSSSDTTLSSLTLVLTSTGNGGCLAVADSLMVTILDQPIINIISDDSICANLPVLSLDGTVTTGYSVLWTVDGFGSVSSPTSQSTTYNVNPADTINGSIMVHFETSGGICPVEEDSLEIFFIDPPVAFAGPDQSFCANEPVALGGLLAGSASSGTWTSTGTGNFDPTNTILNPYYYASALDLSNGSVDLILTTSADFGCIADKDTVHIIYKDAPVADFSNSSACAAENTYFVDESTISSGTIVSWQYDFGDGNTSIANDPIHPYMGSGTFYATLIVESSNNCYDTITKAVYVNPVPVALFQNEYACQGETVQFEDISFLASGNIVGWDWDFNSGEGTSSQQNPSYIFDLAGTYPVMLSVTSDSGCVGTTTSNINVLTGPDAAFTVDPVPALALENVYYTDQTVGAIDEWYWNFGDQIGGNNQNEIHQYANGGVYTITLEVTDTAGCVDTTSQTIQVILWPVLPTAFTPNGDNENDIYIIRGGPFETVDFKIYNNWGQLVFSTTDPNEGWNGTYNNEDAPIGVYTWTFIVHVAPGREPIIQEGDVTLIR
ncbi:MAG: gliding motility-associated C-terminal domain-containing protein [Crocinitomicaceae bacterium]|nr:gliding motility-associated C-terminal domain-containing protein [Crocinitomicaceae bacterium]